MRPELLPKKLTRRSASPSEKVFKMMASVSLAGMSCRRADAWPDTMQSDVRFARTRRTHLITIHARATQCLRSIAAKKAVCHEKKMHWSDAFATSSRKAPATAPKARERAVLDSVN